MSNKSFLEILTVKFNDVIKGASLSDIKSYFKNFDQTNISNAFNATRNKQKGVITAKEWPAFTKKFYNLQVESQSGFKSLLNYEDKKNQIKRDKKELICESFGYLNLKDAIKDYNNENYKSAYQSFRGLTCEGSKNATDNEDNQIYCVAMYYLAHCYLNGNGTEKNEKYALAILKNIINL
ncbi:2365_t:CDS:2 [Dentiscutata erythropus]|uniref:2365_t:CDS:1 n=1 Tax=Dentiscutata erythropus TaxID=1348616 RepID=A0A9N9HMP8_9GLOM|nr:2365_t:CDS:2 [Dentiscutata erythropus]